MVRADFVRKLFDPDTKYPMTVPTSSRLSGLKPVTPNISRGIKWVSDNGSRAIKAIAPIRQSHATAPRTTTTNSSDAA